MGIEQEKEAFGKLLDGLEAQGWIPYFITYPDDGDGISIDGLPRAKIIEEASACDIVILRFRHEGVKGNVASAMVVWGNSPEDLIADYTTSHGFTTAIEQAAKQAGMR